MDEENKATSLSPSPSAKRSSQPGHYIEQALRRNQHPAINLVYFPLNSASTFRGWLSCNK